MIVFNYCDFLSMKFKKALITLLGFTSLLWSVPEEKIPAHEVYAEIMEVFQEQAWEDLIDISKEFIVTYPESSFIKEIYYVTGIAYFNLQDYEFANDYFTQYLKQSAPKHFEEAIYHKFLIAEQFRLGAKKRIFKWQKDPGYLSAKEDALLIYDEIVSTFPYHDLAAKALFGKALIQMENYDFTESIETFQQLIQKFPRHEYAIESYLEIGRVYLLKCQKEHLDPDLLDRAENNFSKFKKAFPGEERLKNAWKTLAEIKETFAQNLYETGRFYERTKKKGASVIYYAKVVSKFPNTKAAKLSQKRLDTLQKQ